MDARVKSGHDSWSGCEEAPRMTYGAKHIGEPMLKVDNITLAFGGVKALSDISFEIRKHEILAIIGPNGAGKTSMLNVINGFYHPQQGRIEFRGVERRTMRPHLAARQGIARTFQNVALFKGMSTLDNIIATCCSRRSTGAPTGARRLLIAKRSRRSSISSRSRRSARHRSAGCPTACRSASSWRAPSPWSPICCCSTSRWPA
jgi:ABC-type branched-subunit amino acid transport system ATPase component